MEKEFKQALAQGAAAVEAASKAGKMWTSATKRENTSQKTIKKIKKRSKKAA